MRVLIVPMAAMAQTSGPASRCSLLARSLIANGAEVATCAAEDPNFRPVDGADDYFLDVPTPLGLPQSMASRVFPIAQKLGVTSRKTVKSFDQVLDLTGNLRYGYISKSVSSIRRAIGSFRPDVVYSEFNLSALIAAKIEGVRSCATVSFPTRHEYANDPSVASGLNRFLGQEGLPGVQSALQIFKYAERTFCFSIPELEPFPDGDTIFCGALKKATPRDLPRNKILVYMGNGTISAQKMLDAVKGAFGDSEYEVYIGSSYLEKGSYGNINVAPRWDFDTLLEEAAIFIDHGGQNSVVDGLLHGVPQLMIPGKVFERQYNARCIEDAKAGEIMSHEALSADALRDASKRIISDKAMYENARSLGVKLTAYGGVDTVVKNILSM